MDLDEENSEQNPNKYSSKNKDNMDNPNIISHNNYNINDSNIQKQPTKQQYPNVNPNIIIF
jgi:hypothetical protein